MPTLMRTLVALWMLCITTLAWSCCGNNNDNEMLGGYGFGLGVGQSHTTGDFIQSRRVNVFSIGLDAEKKGVLFIFNGSADTNPNNETSSLSLILGGGWRYLKIGTGFITQKTSVPTTNMVQYPLITTDQGRLTHLSVTTVPLYLRLHPLITEHIVLSVDGYYGLHTRGSMSVPVTALGMNATMDTETQHADGARGAGASIIWRFGGSNRFGLKLENRVNEGHMDRNKTGFHGDVLGAFSAVTVPEISFRNRTTMLSFVGTF